MKIVVKPDVMNLFCEECKRITLHQLIRSVGEYICTHCGNITMMGAK